MSCKSSSSYVNAPGGVVAISEGVPVVVVYIYRIDLFVWLILNLFILRLNRRCSVTEALTDVTAPNRQPERTVDRSAALTAAASLR